MENTGDNRHEGAKQGEDNERMRMSGLRSVAASLSPHIQIDDQDSTKISIRKAQREEYRRKRNKTNNEEQTKDGDTGFSSENESMEGSDGRGAQLVNIKEIRDMTKAVIKCIEIAYAESTKKSPSPFDKTDLYQFVEAQERRMVLQLEKNLILAEQNLSLAEQALFLSNNNNRETNQGNEQVSGANKLYAEILMKENTTKIQEGKKLSSPVMPSQVKHFSSECVIITKANKPGRIVTENELRRGKDKLCRQIGNILALEIMVIRTTRSGGYIIVLKTPAKREEIKAKLINDELLKDRIILPKAKLPKVICRNITEEFTIEELQRDIYSWKNQKLHTIPTQERKANIIQTRLGIVIELSSTELMAIELQDWRIRFGYGNELKVEEFIPIQQCYNCSCFGHSADNCKNMPRCRLCASAEHSGRDCNKRMDKTQWKCTNCLDSNLRRNTKLNYNHGAAQLHKCQIALNEKEIKRQQMANEGIYVSKSSELKTGIMQNTANNRQGHNGRILETITKGGGAQRIGQYDEDRGKYTYMENEKRKKNMNTEMQLRTEIEKGRKKGTDKSESENEAENEEEENETTGISVTEPRQVRSVQSQRKGFGQIFPSDEGDIEDNGWSFQRRGRSKNTGRQRSVSRIRRSGLVAKPLYHTRSTTSLGEELLAYSPIKRKDVIRRGRPARSGDTTNEDDVLVDTQIRRMTPRSEGHGVRIGRIGGYVDRRGGESHKESDEAMSVGGEILMDSKSKDRNER